MTVGALTLGGPLKLQTWATGGEPSSPSPGWYGFNTTAGAPAYYNGSAWILENSGTIPGGTYLPLIGGTVTGTTTFAGSGSGLIVNNNASIGSLLLTPGSAPPAAPVNGTMWATNAGLFVQIGGLPQQINVTPTGGGGTTYFVSSSGSDSANGTSASTPWLTIAHANLGASYAGGGLSPGQTLAFNGGNTFTGCLKLGTATNIASSLATNPITVTSYGAGTAIIVPNCPAADAGAGSNYGPKNAAVTIDGSGAGLNGLVFEDITVSTTVVATTSSAVQYGILIQSSGGNASSYITVQNTIVRGFNIAAPDDSSAEIAVLGDASNGACGALSNISILSNVLSGQIGAASTDDQGISGYGCGLNITTANYSGNTIYNMGGRAGLASGNSTGNAILFNGVNGGIAQGNVAYALGGNNTTCGGPGGIWAYSSSNIAVQYNEVYGMVPLSFVSGCDWDAYDIDNNVSNMTVAYNYAHNNWGPCIETSTGGATGTGNSIHDNVCENNLLGQTVVGGGEINIGGYLPSSGVATIQVYNNTIFNHNSTSLQPVCIAFFYAPSAGIIANNSCDLGINGYGGTVFYNFGGVGTMPGMVFKNNDYHSPGNGFAGWSWSTGGNTLTTFAAWQAVAPGGDTGSILTAPVYSGSVPVGTCTWSPAPASKPQPCPQNYRLAHTSPNIGTGINLNASPYNVAVFGTSDYYGVAKPNGILSGYNIGADGAAE